MCCDKRPPHRPREFPDDVRVKAVFYPPSKLLAQVDVEVSERRAAGEARASRARVIVEALQERYRQRGDS